MPLADAGALSHVRQQLIARVGVAEIDLRALAAAALAVSPFFVWNMVDRLADPYQRYETTASLIVGQVQLAEGLILTTFGYVFVALGWALYRQRKAKRLLPFAFVAASLGVATLLANARSIPHPAELERAAIAGVRIDRRADLFVRGSSASIPRGARGFSYVARRAAPLAGPRRRARDLRPPSFPASPCIG